MLGANLINFRVYPKEWFLHSGALIAVAPWIYFKEQKNDSYIITT